MCVELHLHQLTNERENIVEKVIVDERDAVLYSPGYGAGWSTWAEAEEKVTLCMDARIVQPFLDGGPDAATTAAVGLFPDFYTGGADQLKVSWIPEGRAFLIEVYDGYESIKYLDAVKFFVA